MICWLMDTDVLSLQERGHPKLRERLASAPPDSVDEGFIDFAEVDEALWTSPGP